MNNSNNTKLGKLGQKLKALFKTNTFETATFASDDDPYKKIKELEGQLAAMKFIDNENLLTKELSEKVCEQCREGYLKDFQLHRSILENPVEIIIFAVDKDYCYTAFSKFHNETMKRIYGADIQVGMNMLSLISDTVIRQRAKQNIDRSLQGEHFVQTEEFGDKFHKKTVFNCYHSPIKDLDDLIIGVIIFMIDITELMSAKHSAMQSEKMLRESEEKYRLIADNTSDGILYVGPDNQALYASPAFFHQLGYTESDNIIHPLPGMFALIHPDERETLKALLIETIEQKKEGLTYSYRIKHKCGKYIWREDNSHFQYDSNGNFAGSFTICRDITERKQVEIALNEALIKSQAGNRLKTAFMQNISHEVRTPLNGILGFGELLTEPNLSKEVTQQYLQMMNISGKRLLNTITDYMDVSLIESGNVEVTYKTVKINNLITKLVPEFEEICNEKKLAFHLAFAAGSDEVSLITDPELLRKCIYQLMDNAVKFTHQGAITLGCEVGSDSIEFSIRDTGIGINPEAHEFIFEPFMQEITDKTHGYEGNGLGLSITKGFLKLLGGKIRVESIKGQGATFYISLPRESAEVTNHEITRHGIKTDTKSQMEILIAEDDLMSDIYMEKILKPYVSVIHKAINGFEAVNMVRMHPEISLVLIDLKLPVMSGFEATREIKSFRKSLPVIAVTAYALGRDKKAAFEAGVDDFLAKPVSKEQLLQKLIKYGLMT